MEDRPLHSVYPPQIENVAGLNDSTEAGSAVSIKASLSKFECFSFKKNQNFQQTCSLLPHHLLFLLSDKFQSSSSSSFTSWWALCSCSLIITKSIKQLIESDSLHVRKIHMIWCHADISVTIYNHSFSSQWIKRKLESEVSEVRASQTHWGGRGLFVIEPVS